MAISTTEKEVLQRVISLDKKDLIELFESKVYSANLPIILSDNIDFKFKCWNHKGTKVCEDLEKLEVVITRVRSI
mgnify:CR=1 FL=1